MRHFFALFALFFLTMAMACAPSALAQQRSTPISVPGYDIGGTVTLGGTYQTVAAQNSSRLNCTIQNPSGATEVLNVKFGNQTQPYVLGAGQSISSNNGVVNNTSAITVTAATTSHAFAGTCQ